VQFGRQVIKPLLREQGILMEVFLSPFQLKGEKGIGFPKFKEKVFTKENRVYIRVIG